MITLAGAALPPVAALALAAAPTALPTATPAPDAGDATGQDILVTASKQAQTIEAAPNSRASIDADQIKATVNATNIEDTVKYLPSLVVRKRHIGDTQAPLATRTSGVGASARSLIYADGALLSSLIGNNNTSASPQWFLVTPQEVARIDVLYGPFSAAYAGNSIGAVVNITTRLPDRLEAQASIGATVQQFDQYGTHGTFPSYQGGASLGDRFGRLAVFASYQHVSSNSQPLAYATATRPANPSTTGTPVAGGYDDTNRTGAAIRVLGATGLEHQEQDFIKFKAAFDVTPAIRLTYVGGVFLNATNGAATSYLNNGATPVYSGTLNIGGYAYNVPASSFSNNVYRTRQTHVSHSLSLTGTSGRVDWQVIGTLFDFTRDEQRVPTAALPTGFSGGAGNLTRLDGTGWYTIDAKGAWRIDDAGRLVLSTGYHRDEYRLKSGRYTLAADWIGGAAGALNQASRGTTRIDAAWAQILVRPLDTVSVTLGGRQEWWSALDGYNFSATPSFALAQPRRAASRFSPKASVEWQPAGNWRATLSFGEAWRFPTVTELYQAITTGPTITSPNPNLKPERALSEELALQYGGEARFVRLSLFNEVIDDALQSQTAPLVPGSTTLFSYVQNVDRVRTRGLELAFQQTDVIRNIDVSGSVTLVDPRIRADAAFPLAVGKRPPQLPTTRATLVATWRPGPRWSLSAAGRYSSRSFASIDNSDTNDFTYQGFGSYFVADMRAVVKLSGHWDFALGVDNIADRRYFLFHPFTGRTFSAQLNWRL